MRFLALFTFLPAFLFAQPVFQHLFPLPGFDVRVADVQQASGNTTLVGGTATNEQNGEVLCLVAQASGSGTLLWSRTWSTGNNDGVTALTPATGGGIVLTYSSPSEPDDRGGVRFFDTDGQSVWSLRTTVNATFRGVHPLANGDFAVVGSAETPGGGNRGAAVYRIAGNGQTLWRSGFFETGADIELSDVWEDDQGFLYAAGYEVRPLVGGDGVVCRFTPAGQLEWVRRFESTGDNRFFRIVYLGAGPDIVVGGHAAVQQGFRALNLAALRTDGSIVWSNTYALPNSDINFSDLVQAPAGAMFTLSSVLTNPAHGRINSNGQLLSLRSYDPPGATGTAPQIASTQQDGFVWADGVLDGSGRHLVMMRTDDNGNVPPCCLKSANLDVREFTLSLVTPAIQTFQPTGLQNTAFPVVEPAFAALVDVCPDLNTDFTLSDSLICPGECITLTLTNPTPGALYAWLTPGGTADPQDPNRICYSNDGNFSIVPQVNGCAQNLAAKTIKVNTSGNEDVPTAFTPDGDGTNDVFRPLIVCPVADYRFEMYNRWGQKVYETTNPDDAWDGRSAGNTTAVSDVYVWKLSYRSNTGEVSERKGQVTLVR